MYTEDLKYSGSKDSLTYKLTIFHDIYSRVDVLAAVYTKAFPTMLKGAALNYFYSSAAAQICNNDFARVCEYMRKYFEGPSYYRKNLDEWNSISLTRIITENTGKSTSDCLLLLFKKLQL